MSEFYVANRAAVAHEAFDEETVLINFERGTYFSLRESAPAIWDMLQNPITTDDLLASLGDLPVDGPASVIGLLDRLHEEGCLLRTGGEAAAARDPCTMPTGDFVAPVFEAFHDLSVLMGIELLPIGENQFNNWPVPAPAYAMAD